MGQPFEGRGRTDQAAVRLQCELLANRQSASSKKDFFQKFRLG
jgi:hypothetical protein